MSPRGEHCTAGTSLMERWGYSAGRTVLVPSGKWLSGDILGADVGFLQQAKRVELVRVSGKQSGQLLTGARGTHEGLANQEGMHLIGSHFCHICRSEDSRLVRASWRYLAVATPHISMKLRGLARL